MKFIEIKQILFSSQFRHWAIIFLISVVIIQCVYLSIANILLNTDLLKNRINKRPDRLLIQWDSGYTVWPGKINLHRMSVRFQKNKLQWCLNTDTITGHISLIKLLFRIFHISDVVADGVTYQYIIHNEPFKPVPKAKHRWILFLEDLQMNHIKKCSVNNYSIEGNGNAQGSIKLITRKSVQILPSEITFEGCRITHKNIPISEKTSLKLNLQSPPFIPSEYKGKRIMEVLNGKLSGEGTFVKNNDWINVSPKNWFSFRDSGAFSFDIRFEAGKFLKNSFVTMNNVELDVFYKDMTVNGKGKLSMVLNEPVQSFKEFKTGNYHILMNNFSLSKKEMPVIKGSEMIIIMENQFSSLSQSEDKQIFIELKNADIENISSLNAFMGSNQFFRFEEGTAKLSGSLQYSPENENGSGKAVIKFNNSKIALKEKPIEGNFEFEMNFHEFKPGKSDILIDGYITLTDKKNKILFKTDVKKSKVFWPDDVSINDIDNSNRISSLSAKLNLEGVISDISLFNNFLGRHNQFLLSGEGTFLSEFLIDQGDIGARSFFEFSVPNIEGRFKGYSATGTANFRLNFQEKLSKNHKRNYISAIGNLVIKDYIIKNQDTSGVHSFGKKMNVDILISDFQLKNERPETEISISVAENIIPDFKEYNSLWHKDAPFKILSGNGKSTFSFSFSDKKNSFQGKYSMSTYELKMSYDTIPITADIAFHGNVSGVVDDIHKLNFNGSTLTLENVIVDGVHQRDWKMSCEMQNSLMHWKNPFEFNGQLKFSMKDTSPIITFFIGKSRFLSHFEHILTIRDIMGNCSLDINCDYFSVKKMQISGDNLRILGKLKMNKFDKQGGLYVKYKKIPVSVTLDGNDRDLHIIQPLKKFNNFDISKSKYW